MTTLERAWMRHLETVRWFGGKGAGARISRLAPLPWWTKPDASPSVRSEIATLDFPDGHVEHYHLLSAHYRADATAAGAKPVGATAATLGTWDGATVVDATADPAAVAAFVAATQPAFADRAVEVYRGEQSNTTILLGDTDLYKLYRRIEPGPNLEAEVLTALAGGSVPALRARLEGAWPAGSTTDLGIVVERIPGARDGWELATAACAAGEDFAERAADLGRVLRDTHMRLAEAFGNASIAGDSLADAMGARLDAAVTQAASLRPHATALRAAFDALRGRDLPVQRIHGDFHLGQTLATGRGWTIIDFEGEPAKTAAERRAFDSPWRDVAGMVRSLDYVRSASHDGPTQPAATRWADRARDAFLKGYCGLKAERDILAAYVIDKAVYEVLYELRNRPEWVAIPMRAIRETTGAQAEPETDDKEQ